MCILEWLSNKEVYVEQTSIFKNPEFSNHMKLHKVFYGLKQAPIACLTHFFWKIIL